jgi:NAD-dependent dihydropyrimidine dehydrogenase PreA subunit
VIPGKQKWGGFWPGRRRATAVDDLWERLRGHLDDLPGGYPATESGVEIRILKRLFSEEEAQLVLQLTPLLEPPRVIAKRAGLTPEEASKRLYDLSRKGLVYRVTREGENQYMAVQFIIGIWEFHVNDLDPGLVEDVNEYLPHLIDNEIWERAPQLRTIPVNHEITVGHEIMPYEQAEEIVRSRRRLAVAPCICRKEHQMVGEGCDRPVEACLVFNGGADFYIENELAREIDAEEALDILKRAGAAGLVLQPSNSQSPTNICCCCGCCCQALLAFKRHPEPAALVSSPFIVAHDPDTCIACEVCIDRCQMDAIALAEEVVEVDLKKCIGCGLCVPTCSTESLVLERKPEAEQRDVPVTQIESHLNRARIRGKLSKSDEFLLALRAAKNRLMERGRC